MNSIRDRAEYFLRTAFDVEDVERIILMLHAACDQTAEKLVERLSAALLKDGLWVAVDRNRIGEIIQQQTDLVPIDVQLDAFIESNYENEFGPAKDALEDSIRVLLDGTVRSTDDEQVDCDDALEIEADAYLSRFDDDPSPYDGTYSEE